MVMDILGEGRGRFAMLVKLNAPAVEFDLVQPLLAARWRLEIKDKRRTA
jgi:hypothetical protein